MLDSLLETTLKRRNEIHEYFENIQRNINIKEVEEEFNYFSPAKQKQDKNFAAIDGSFNKKKYMACFIYAIASQTIISKRNESLVKESAASDINMITSLRSRSIDSILSTRMNILELKSAVDTLNKYPEIDYMLLDGSIYGTLRYFPTYNLPQELKSYITGINKEILHELTEDNIPLEVTTIAKRNQIREEMEELINTNNLEIEYDNIEGEVLRYMESLEQLECIYTLLNKFKNKIICISKTSNTNSLYKKSIPDSAVLEYTINKPGYTNMKIVNQNEPVIYENNRRKPYPYPIHNKILRNYKYTSFFTKLSEKANIIKIEIPSEITDRKTIENILNDLYSSSIDGYPYILTKAHNEVVIKNKDMINIINRLEIYEKTGRDMLEH